MKRYSQTTRRNPHPNRQVAEKPRGTARYATSDIIRKQKEVSRLPTFGESHTQGAERGHGLDRPVDTTFLQTEAAVETTWRRAPVVVVVVVVERGEHRACGGAVSTSGRGRQ